MANILIVDDLLADRNFLVGLLGAEGYCVREAADGRQGLAAVQAAAPDLVIADVLMPVMDGCELVRQLRLDPATRGVPVLLYVASYGEREARAFAQANGACDVLAKHAKPEEVLAIASRMLAGEWAPAIPAGSGAPRKETDREHLRLLGPHVPEEADDLKRANTRLRALVNIGLELASEQDPERLLQSVCVATRDLFGATYVTLGILDLNDRTVQRVVTCGSHTASWVKPGDSVLGILGTVVAERRTVRGDSSSVDSAALSFPPYHPEVQTFLAAPLVSPSQVYGWFCLVGNDGKTFSQDDEHLVTALAGQVGRIYESSHFSAEARKRAEQLEHEILERKQAESALRRERDRAQRYLDTAEVMLVRLDVDGRVALANRYACDVLGWSADELLGRDWIETCLPARIRDEFRAKFRDLMAGDLFIGENPVLTKSGEERLIEWRNRLVRDDEGRVTGAFSSGTDVTERRMLEEQYQQAQKMEAIGQLAGGVAHDFNNLLTAILGYCGLLRAGLPEDDPRQIDVDEIHKAGVSAAGLTRQLLAFSRKEIIEPTLLDLNVVVSDVRVMLDRLIGEDVDVVLSLSPDMARVKADRGQVEQIIVNLAVNARDAMPAGGTLTIETADVQLDEHYAKTHVAVQPGPYVRLTVTDTGTGMTPHVQARLFEPFFTTKAIGKGTGLGLATVHGIITRSGGSVSVQSEIGKGTSFKVYFPKANGAESVASVLAAVAGPLAAAHTVLVVEDEEALRELVRRLLVQQGYTVLVAANADDAAGLFERNPSIDVLLTDVVMPGASGPELTTRLIAQRPALKVIYMSGYTDEAIVQQGVLNPGITFMHKPFTSETLGRKIHEALEREAPSPAASLVDTALHPLSS